MSAVELDLQMQKQEQGNWCWSAVAVSVSRFLDGKSRWTQCLLANAELRQTTCCASGGSARCNRPWYLDRALRRTGNDGGTHAGTLRMDQIRAELQVGSPVGFRVEWPAGGAHFAAITGVSASDIVRTDDPLYGRSFYPLARLKRGYESVGVWTDSYRTKKAAP